MKIIDVRCATIGQNPVVRLVTDSGLSGYGPVEHTKTYIKPFVMHLRDAVIGEDPTNVERVMLRIRQRGAFKPYGAAVSAIEIALWDLAGKAAGVPIYKLLGGKVRDRVRVYNGAIREPMTSYEPEDFANSVRQMKAAPQGFTMVKQGIGFHSGMKREMDGFFYGEIRPNRYHGQMDRGLLTERGLRRIIDCIDRDEGGARRRNRPGAGLRPRHDGARRDPAGAGRWSRTTSCGSRTCSSGDYVPFVNADVYREVTMATSTPIHTGEQIYLRQNFKQLIETHAVNVVGPDPVRCRRPGRTEMDRRIRRPARRPDGAARHRQRPARGRRPGAGVRDAARQFHRLRAALG